MLQAKERNGKIENSNCSLEEKYSKLQGIKAYLSIIMRSILCIKHSVVAGAVLFVASEYNKQKQNIPHPERTVDDLFSYILVPQSVSALWELQDTLPNAQYLPDKLDRQKYKKLKQNLLTSIRVFFSDTNEFDKLRRYRDAINHYYFDMPKRDASDNYTIAGTTDCECKVIKELAEHIRQKGGFSEYGQFLGKIFENFKEINNYFPPMISYYNSRKEKEINHGNKNN